MPPIRCSADRTSESKKNNNPLAGWLAEMKRHEQQKSGIYKALVPLPLHERQSDPQKAVDSVPAGAEVLLCGIYGSWAKIKRDDGRIFWTPLVDDVGNELMARVLPAHDTSFSKRRWQYQRVHDALEVCMEMTRRSEGRTTLFIPDLPLDLLQQLELAGCQTDCSGFVNISSKDLRSFRTLDNLQQRIVTAQQQLSKEGRPRVIAPGRFPTANYGIVGKRLEQLLWAMGAGPATEEAAGVVEAIRQAVFPDYFCFHSGSANVGTNLLDSDIDLVVAMEVRDRGVVELVYERILLLQQEKQPPFNSLTIHLKPFCVTLQGARLELDVVPVFPSEDGRYEQFDQASGKWKLYHGKDHAKQFMMATDRIERLPDLVRLAKAWNKRLSVRREDGKPLLPGLLIQLCLTQLELPKPESECTLAEQVFFAFSHLRAEWRTTSQQEPDTYARMLAKVDGLEEEIDEALDRACQQLLKVVELEKLEKQHLFVAKRQFEESDSSRRKLKSHVFPIPLAEVFSEEAVECADEATTILNDLFGTLQDYLRYDPMFL